MNDALEFAKQNFQLGLSETTLVELLGESSILRLQEKFGDTSRSKFSIAAREILRYLYLAINSPSSVFFPGDELMDEIWHALITETASYRELCHKFRPGAFLDHSGVKFSDYSRTLSAEALHEEQLSWLASYIRNFGPIEQASMECLSLVSCLIERSGTDLTGLNKMGSILVELGRQSESAKEKLSFESFVTSKLAPNASRIDSDYRSLGSAIRHLFASVNSLGISNPPVSNSQLETLFGNSAAFAFTLWQHLAVIERLSYLIEWQGKNADLWHRLSKGTQLCGLATTHLAKPGGSSLRGVATEGGYHISGSAPWVCGYRIFDSLLVAFETHDSFVVALIEYPGSKINNAGVTVTPLDLACLNGSSTVALAFENFFVSFDDQISTRLKTSGPAVMRPSNYSIPELGIGRSSLSETEIIAAGSNHPRNALITASIPKMKERLREIEELRAGNAPIDKLICLRDSFNHDAVRLLVLAGGASSLAAHSTAARRQLELMLLDSVIQPPSALQAKIVETATGKHEYV